MRPASVELFPAPSKGWVQSGNVVLAGKDQAEVLDNFWPTAQGARLRGGCVEYADCETPIQRLFVYDNGPTQTMFASSGTDIFDTASPTTSVRGSLSSGDWSTTQITTAGGTFLVGANGVDPVWNYDGSTFTAPTINNVSSSALGQVWLFKERLFFVEKDTMSVWYLPVEQIAGDASEINLGSIFSKGGSILFGATWSVDSGSGLDDVCIFVTDKGEVAVYQGTNPASAADWRISGIYDIGVPLDKHAFFKAGGDLAILTIGGIVSIASAANFDRAALQANAITFPIEDAWQGIIANRATQAPITATLWQAETLLFVGTSNPIALAANASTGAWARNVGWSARCSVVFNDRLYFADNAGKVFEADRGGTDNGVQYTAHYVPKFASSDVYLSAHMAGITYRSPNELDFDLSAHGDYGVEELPSPAVALTLTGEAWGTAVWGDFIWGGSDSLKTFSQWQAVGASGYSLAPGVSVTSNQQSLIPFEILSTRLRFERGNQV